MSHRLSDEIRRLALDCGFDAVGICSAQILQPERERYLAWIEQGRQGEMRWIDADWVDRASNPRGLLDNARSVVCVALSYAGPPRQSPPSGHGKIARYASGRDYHVVLQERLQALSECVRNAGGSARSFADTAPTMDKALAGRAGLGWQGRNTNLLNRSLGSFTFLGGIITNLDLEPDVATNDGCGTCRACVVACPTGALKGDYTIDARLCISYLTIEHRGPIPRELRGAIGSWVFGCDICQDVCPVVWKVQDDTFPERKQDRINLVRSILE